jgi:hypothetical protein
MERIMKVQLASIAFATLIFSGCGGGGCPTIYIPVYEINVYDSVSGTLICHEGLGTMPDVQDCEIAYSYTEDGLAADITVALPGYSTETAYSVENQTWRSGCWDNPEYTTSKDIYLTPN